MPDNRLLLPPFSEVEVENALARLRIGPLFRGVRGAKPLNARAVYEVARGVAELLVNGGAVSMDINPLIATSEGATAADALLEVRR